MTVLLINGSPNAKGSTYTALNEVAMALNSMNVETEIVHVGHKDIRGCIGCRKCKKIGKCVFEDIVNETAPKFEACDGIVIGTPVYFASANGTVVSFIDRLFYSVPFDKRMKVGATVMALRRGGASSTFDEMNKYFTISEMPVASSGYWNSVHGHNAEEVKQDLEGMQVMRTLGKNMAFLMKSIELGKKELGLPEREERVFTNFIR